MRLLVDENFPRPAVEALRAEGFEVSWVRESMPGTADSELLELAEANRLILLTLDKDFLQLTLLRRNPLVEGGVILFRLRSTRTQVLVPHVLKAVRQDIDCEERLARLGRMGLRECPGEHSGGEGSAEQAGPFFSYENLG